MQSIEQIVQERRVGRLVSMIEASVWVGGGLVLLDAAGLLLRMPVGYRAGISTVIGGVLLGSGAFVNRACAFGTIGRIGAGQWSYLAMPIGFLVGEFRDRTRVHAGAAGRCIGSSCSLPLG